jgi:hypothetical protein
VIAAAKPTATQELARLQAVVDHAHAELIAAGNRMTQAMEAVEAHRRERPKEIAAARAAGKPAPKDRYDELETKARVARDEHDAAQELVAIRVREMVETIETNSDAWLAEAERRVESARAAVADQIAATEERAHELADAQAERRFLRDPVYFNERMGQYQVRPRNAAVLASEEINALRRALL